MTSTQPKATVKGNRPDALDDPTKMALAAPLLTEGVELAAAKMREDQRGGLFLDLAIAAARRYVQQSITVAEPGKATAQDGGS
jgi:hypothetical protein